MSSHSPSHLTENNDVNNSNETFSGNANNSRIGSTVGHVISISSSSSSSSSSISPSAVFNSNNRRRASFNHHHHHNKSSHYRSNDLNSSASELNPNAASFSPFAASSLANRHSDEVSFKSVFLS
jgi:hypothetical protein